MYLFDIQIGLFDTHYHALGVGAGVIRGVGCNAEADKHSKGK